MLAASLYDTIMTRGRKLEIETLRTFEELLDKYGLNRVALSFNGGKDITVVFHLIRAVVEHKQQLFTQRESQGQTSWGEQKPSLHDVMVVYFEQDDEFPEILSFMKEIRKKYAVNIEHFTCDFREGTQALVDRGVKAFCMGTRQADPDGRSQGVESPSSGGGDGWPTFTRLNPIISWKYEHVWNFLLSYSLPYCELYAQV